MSGKGWTDGEIGVDWIKDFDEQTQDKANGNSRLLLVDGHKSHFTHGFIGYAVEHNIHIFCYPPHTTHILQGLDVAVFGAFKKIWGQKRAWWISDNFPAPFGKSAWLTVWSDAFLEVMKESTICAAFRATGFVPYNPSIITNKMVAPSIEHSSTGSLPVPHTSPIKKIIRFQQLLLQHNSDADPDITADRAHPSQDLDMFGPRTPSANMTGGAAPDTATPGDSASAGADALHDPDPDRGRGPTSLVIDPALQEAALLAETLSTSTASLLVSPIVPLPSEYRLPEHFYGAMPDLPLDLSFMKESWPTTKDGLRSLVCHQRAAIETYSERELQAKKTISATNSALAIAAMAHSKSQLQLLNAEDQQKKKRTNTHLKLDGRARILTHPAFVQEIREAEEKKRDDERQKDAREALL
jgi:hypothetical protein